MDGGNVMAIQDPLTELIIGCCFRELGPGFLEKVHVLVEVKAASALGHADVAQCLNYMRGTRLVTCLLVNFGRAKIQVRRLGMTRTAATGDVELEVKDVQ
jgi:hypothetical protein